MPLVAEGDEFFAQCQGPVKFPARTVIALQPHKYGEKVFGRDQWLNGTRFDRFVTPIRLKAGRNTLLVKVCQGPQHKDPEVPNNWTVQLRLCDVQGRGIEFKPMETAK